MEKNANFNYDSENDTLFIFPKKRKPSEYLLSQWVDEDIILDIDKNKRPIGIEILSASKKLDIKKSLLNRVSKWQTEITINKNIIKINIKLTYKNKLSEKDLAFEKINKHLLKSGAIAMS